MRWFKFELPLELLMRGQSKGMPQGTEINVFLQKNRGPVAIFIRSQQLFLWDVPQQNFLPVQLELEEGEGREVLLGEGIWGWPQMSLNFWRAPVRFQQKLCRAGECRSVLGWRIPGETFQGWRIPQETLLG